MAYRDNNIDKYNSWWESRYYCFSILLLSILPMVFPKIPPLVDLPGHIGRFSVQLNPDNIILSQYYSFNWHLIGNLGFDIFIIPFSLLFDLESSVKIVVIIIPLVTCIGLLAVAHEIHGRLPATAVFALPIAYCFPFQYGFVNFSLSMAFALAAFALWLRLSRMGRTSLRTVCFIPISLGIWLCHTFGWGFLGLLCAASLISASRTTGKSWSASFWSTGLSCLPLLAPLIPMLLWRSQVSEAYTGGWFLMGKLFFLSSILRTEWKWIDITSVIILMMIIYIGIRSPKIKLDRTLGLASIFCFIVFVFMPFSVFGSLYADMRLAPYAVALAILSIDTSRLDARVIHATAIAGLLFYLMRIAVTTTAFIIHGNELDRHLEALNNIPRGARIVSLVAIPCPSDWELPRLSHIGGIAIERKHVFANDQWQTDGVNLLKVHFPQGQPFDQDPSQMISPRRCPASWSMTEAIARIPRNAFTHLWVVGSNPKHLPVHPGFDVIWQGQDSVVYRIRRERQATLKPFVRG